MRYKVGIIAFAAMFCLWTFVRLQPHHAGRTEFKKVSVTVMKVDDRSLLVQDDDGTSHRIPIDPRQAANFQAQDTLLVGQSKDGYFLLAPAAPAHELDASVTPSSQPNQETR